MTGRSNVRSPLLAVLLVAGGVTASHAQQPLGTAVDANADAATYHASARVTPALTPVSARTQAQPAQRRASQPTPAVEPQLAVALLALDTRVAGDTIDVVVHTTGDVPWSLSEPFYLDDRVRLHLDIAAAAAQPLSLPAPAGSLVGMTATADGESSRLLIDVARVSAYTARTEDGRIVLRIETAAGEEPASAPAPPIETGRSPALLAALAAARTAGDDARHTADRLLGAATAPANRGVTAPLLGVLLALLGGGIVRLAARRRRPAPRSVVLGVTPREPVAAALPKHGGQADRADRVKPAVSGAAAPPAPAVAGRARRRAAGTAPVNAHSLAAAGLSRGEIAARLRTSRDAVNLLLTIAAGPDEPAAAGRNCPAGPASRGFRLFGARR